MTTTGHDTLVYRLAQMLVKLNQGGKLDPQALAEEFGVNLRTIQRDLNVRFAYLPLQKTDGRYHLDPAFLGKLSTRDIERFASLAGVRGLFPSLSDDFLRDIFDARIQTALLVKGHHYEDLAGKEDAFRQLELAIVSRRHVTFVYRKGDGNKSYASIEPFKLMNHKGIWYLAARDCDKLKTFAFTKIEQLRVLDSQFEPDADIEKRLTGEDGIWMGEEKKEIVLKISREVASYFKRRRLIANQVVEKELEDGGLIVSAKVGHPNQVLPIVRYWIPHIHIISPEGLQSELEHELAEYISHSSSKPL
ncbi:MAG: transcriptional regulator [Betaproteobacteria bacterium HGW-Betaproteobacteria-14]|nr:MAG: transcriptional regulator [Betaproteobacteria bacterium HGW-Betaproteobacteria-14]